MYRPSRVRDTREPEERSGFAIETTPRRSGFTRAAFQRLSGLGVSAFLTAFSAAANAGDPPYAFSHLVGNPGGAGGTDGAGSAARFTSPYGLASDATGNLYVADTRAHTIRKITPQGFVTTLAGLNGVPGSADGTGSAARFKSPWGVAVDAAGNVYVADTYNYTIRKITPQGVVSTLAGQPGVAAVTDGTGSGARFHFPSSIAVDPAGTVYVCEQNASFIRKVTPAGVVSAYAGLSYGFGSADGTGAAARFSSPFGIAADAAGNVYVADRSNWTIRKIAPGGVVTTLAGQAGSSGSADGVGTAARFLSPASVVVDATGTVVVGDSGLLRAIGPGGSVTTRAGSPTAQGSANGSGASATFTYLYGLAADAAGNVYATDNMNHTIRRITPAGNVTTFAGLGGAGTADGTGTSAGFFSPLGVAARSDGTLYVLDSYNHSVRKVTPAGVVTTLAGVAQVSGSVDGAGSAARFRYPYGIALAANGDVYVADSNGNTIRKVTPDGTVTTVAGLAFTPGEVDGTGAAARFSFPTGLAFDAAGNLYVTDTNGQTVRKMTPAGVVTTLAGKADAFGSADGTGSAARFTYPWGLVVDPSGNVYVGDSGNGTIRKITPGGVVTTLAGKAGQLGNVDGTGAAARFSAPRYMTLDGAGNLLVSDASGHAIRQVTPDGVVTTFAGKPGVAGSSDGVGAAASFNAPNGIARDGAGNLYIADSGNHAIRKGIAGGCTPNATTLCLNQGRFAVSVGFTNYNDGSTGDGKAVALTSDSGSFWFFDAANVELVVKVLDGRQVNGSFWVLYGALSDVGYTLTVTDTSTGHVKSYTNPPHTLASVADVNALPGGRPDLARGVTGNELGELASLQVASRTASGAPGLSERDSSRSALAGAGCQPGATTLCLNQSRFRVRADWKNYNDGSTGSGGAVALTGDSGTFWFFDAANVELVVKVLDGRSVNGHFWVLYGALSDVEYTLTVDDTQSPATRTYHNPPHNLASVADITAL